MRDDLALEQGDKTERQFPLFSPFYRSRSFTALFFGQSLSRFGDAILTVLLPLVVYELTRSTLQMGIVMTCLVTPMVILLPFAGTVVDRVHRVRLMRSVDTIRLMIMIFVTIASWTHHLTMPVLCGSMTLFGVMDAFFQPAYSSVRGEVFTDDIRNAANALTQSSNQIAALVGPALGGLLVGLGSSTLGFGVDSLTYLISVVSLLFVNINRWEHELAIQTDKQRKNEDTGNLSLQLKSFLSSYGEELLGGYRELRKHPWLWITILAFGLVNVASGGITSIMLPWLIKVHLLKSASLYGVITACSGLGALVAAILFGLRPKWRRRGILAYIGTATNGLMCALLAVFHQAPILMASVFVGGAGVMIFGLVWEGSLQELVPTEAYGRVVSLDLLGSYALLPIGYLFTGWISSVVGGIPTIIAEGAVVCIIGVGMLFVPAIWRFN